MTTATTSSNAATTTNGGGEEMDKDNNNKSKEEKNDKNQKGSAAATTSTTTIEEGSAIMTFPSNQEKTVFYNPVQVQNRDLSILMITLYVERRNLRQAMKAHKKELMAKQQQQQQQEEPKKKNKKQAKEEREQQQKLLEDAMKQFEESYKPDNSIVETAKTSGITILEALAASGLRSIRYWKEIPGVKHITINDLEFEAIERAKHNLNINGLMKKEKKNSNNGENNNNENTAAETATTTTPTANDENNNTTSTSNVVLEDNIEREYGICPQIGDATHVMYMSRRPQQLKTISPHGTTQLQQQPMWDVIDLDPYGSAAPFLDGAVQAIENGGLLCITCTDMAALGGSHPETAYGRYAGLPIQSAKYLQEAALRILLYTISVSAARYGRTIKPILSVGMDFYVRVFVEIQNDKKGVTDLSLNIGHVYQSTKCSTFVTLPHGQKGGKNGNVYQSIRLNHHQHSEPSSSSSSTTATTTTNTNTGFQCPETGAPFKVGGPMWLGPLHDQSVVQTALKRLNDTKCMAPNIQLLATRKRLQGLLTTVSEELDTPLFYNLSDLSRSVHANTPPMDAFKAGIYNAGYNVSGYHKDPMAIKTNAPSSVVWDVMRAWLKKHPPAKEPASDSPAGQILAIPPSITVDFTIPKSFQKTNTKLARFPGNPERHWGPKRKASNIIPTTETATTAATEDGETAAAAAAATATTTATAMDEDVKDAAMNEKEEDNNDTEPPLKRVATEEK